MTWVRPPSKLTAQCEEQDGGSSGGSDIANPWREPLLRQHEGTASCLTGMTFCLDGSLSWMRTLSRTHPSARISASCSVGYRFKGFADTPRCTPTTRWLQLELGGCLWKKRARIEVERRSERWRAVEGR